MTTSRRAHRKSAKKIKKRYIILLVLLGLIIATIAGVSIWWKTSVKPPARIANPNDVSLMPEDVAVAEGVHTFLVVGTDKEDYNTDTIMVIAFDTDNDKINILSIPRDTMIKTNWNSKKVNSAYAVGGIEQLEKEIKKLIGFTPDNYVKVNLDAFIEIIDAMGGVKIDVKQNMNYDDPYQNLSIHLKKGEQVLDGEKAMGFVRFRRYPQGDIARIEAQQQFVAAVAEQLTSPANLPSTISKLPIFADIIGKNMETNLTTGEIIWFGKQLAEVDMSTNLQTFTLPGHDQYINNLSYYLPDEKEILEMINAEFNPFDKAITTLDLVNVAQATASNSNKETTPSTKNEDKKADTDKEKDDNDKDTDADTQDSDDDDDETESAGGKLSDDRVTDTTTTDNDQQNSADNKGKDDNDSASNVVFDEFGQPVAPEEPTKPADTQPDNTQPTEEPVSDNPLANEVLPDVSL